MKTPVKYWGTLLPIIESVSLERINVTENDRVVAILTGKAGFLDIVILRLKELNVPHTVAKISGSRDGKAIVFDGHCWDKKGRLVKEG